MNRLTFFRLCSAVLALSPLASVPVHAGPGEAQGEARKERRAGAVLSLREIERRVLPGMSGMQYLGPEFDPEALVYRLKFIRAGHVVFVDVDARSGEVIGQSR
ncbi:MAG TPA: PepSY domain-containing protein [Novosphingobium sp.]|nr:PepSY domain-containing protein [Novosphingobium sp.]HZV08754.1 PepSY domain-containing protein [Novosphingobium sp.]